MSKNRLQFSNSFSISKKSEMRLQLELTRRMLSAKIVENNQRENGFFLKYIEVQ
jgi:hypothetical protein